MKNILLIWLAFLLAACSPATPAAPAAATAAISAAGGPGGAAETPPPAASATLLPAAPSPTPAPTDTAAPAPTPTVTATPLTGPAVAASYPMYMEDNLGFPSTLLALPGGQVWETTSGGGVRVYDSATMKVVKSLDLGVKDKPFTRLAGDEQYVWALFFAPMEGPNPARLFRISRADYRASPVNLPGTCTYDACLWSFILIDKDMLWVGGYDELMGVDRETLETRVQFLFSEQAQAYLPAQVQDLDAAQGGELWALFCTDICYILRLDRQKLVAGEPQEPEKIFFENNSVQFVIELGGVMWAGEKSSGNVDVQPAVLYPLEGEIEKDLSPADGIELPDGLDFLEISGQGYASDGKYLWVRDTGGRRLFWFDPVKRAVGGVLQVYPGEKPGADDPRVVLSISFDGRNLWGGGTATVRIAMPWIQ